MIVTTAGLGGFSNPHTGTCLPVSLINHRWQLLCVTILCPTNGMVLGTTLTLSSQYFTILCPTQTMKLGAIFKLNSPSTQCFSMQQKDPSTIAFTYHAGFFSFVLLLWHVCKMLMMITSSFMTLGTWVMYFMATWKLNNSESSNFPPNAKSFIVAVLELSQGIKGHPGRRNVCFNPPPSATAWSWATCLVAACCFHKEPQKH